MPSSVAMARRSSSPRVRATADLVRLLLDRGADTDIGVPGDGNALRSHGVAASTSRHPATAMR